MFMKYSVYILKCSDGSFYTGVTNNLEERLNQHKSGLNESCYTFKRRPLELVFKEDFQDILLSIEKEKQIKGWTRKKKIALIEKNFDRLPILSQCENTTSHKNHNINKASFDSAQDDTRKQGDANDYLVKYERQAKGDVTKQGDANERQAQDNHSVQFKRNNE
jgi:putative endonuclease